MGLRCISDCVKGCSCPFAAEPRKMDLSSDYWAGKLMYSLRNPHTDVAHNTTDEHITVGPTVSRGATSVDCSGIMMLNCLICPTPCFFSNI